MAVRQSEGCGRRTPNTSGTAGSGAAFVWVARERMYCAGHRDASNSN